MTLSPKLGVVEISTLWHFRLPLPIQMFIKVVSSPRLSGIGMPSPILWSHPLKMQRIVLLSSLLWWELGTNSLITCPGERLSSRRFTSKLSWSWSWSMCVRLNMCMLLCVCVCVCVCVCMCVCVCVYVYMHACVCVCNHLLSTYTDTTGPRIW